MFILCPHCQFLVALDPVSGSPPEGCPRCHGDMQPTVASDPSPTAATPAGHPVDAQLPPQADKIDEAHLVVDKRSDAVAPPQVLAPSAGFFRPQPPLFAGSSEKIQAAAASNPHWRIPSAIAGLTCLLLLQMLLADWIPLAADARWRPVLSTLCNTLGCSLPPWHEPQAFTLLERDVRADPLRSGVLHVTAGFRNDARWEQPWPSLLLTLSDVDGRVAGSRLLTPRDFQATGPTQKTLASGQSVRIAIDILEPTPQVVAFTFDFR